MGAKGENGLVIRGGGVQIKIRAQLKHLFFNYLSIFIGNSRKNPWLKGSWHLT
jgi:hypothetical protein